MRTLRNRIQDHKRKSGVLQLAMPDDAIPVCKEGHGGEKLRAGNMHAVWKSVHKKVAWSKMVLRDV